MATHFRPETLKLSHFNFKDETSYSVPPYQRKYVWGQKKNKDSLEQYIEDIMGMVFEEESEHFFNSLVFIEDKNTNCKEIIDGQQRIITTLLFLAAKAKILEGRNSSLFDQGHFLIENDSLQLKEQEKQAPIDLSHLFTKPDLFGYSLEIKSKKTLAFNESIKENIDSIQRRLEFCLKSFISNEELRETYKAINNEETSNLIKDLIKSYLTSDDPKTTFSNNFNSCCESYTPDLKSSIQIRLIINVILLLIKEDKALTDFFSEKEVILSAYLGTQKAEGLLECILTKEYSKASSYDALIMEAVAFTNAIISFFQKKEINFTPNKRRSKNKYKAKQPYVNNYKYFLESINDKQHQFIEFLLSQEPSSNIIKDISKRQLDKNTLAETASDLFNKHIDQALDNAYIISIVVSNPDNAKALDLALSAFASINSTGASLEAFDIIRSDLYKDLEKDLEDKLSFLSEKEEKISLKRDELLKFFFASQNNKYQKGKLYSQYQKYIEILDGEAKDKKHHFITELETFTETAYYTKYGLISDNEGYKYVPSLNLLGIISQKIKTLHSVIFKILSIEALSTDSKSHLFDLLYIELSRRTVLVGSKSLVNYFEKIMIAIQEIPPASNQNVIVSHIKGSIQEETRDTHSLKRKLTNHLLETSLYNTDITKTILILHEAHMRAESKEVTSSSPVSFSLTNESTIEHIYPQSAKDGHKWKPRLGNLTLLSKSLNSTAGAKEFYKKIIYFYKSGLFRNIQIVKHQIEIFNKGKEEGKKVSIEGIKVHSDKKLDAQIFNNSNENVASQFLHEDIDLEGYFHGDISKNQPGEWLKTISELLADNDKIITALQQLRKPELDCDITKTSSFEKF